MKEIWIARDKNGELIMYEKKPFKDKFIEHWRTSSGWIRFLPKKKFPEVKWSDKEPTKIKLIIDK